MIKSYFLADTFDGRCIHLLLRISCRKTARRVAAKFMRSYHDDADLIEVMTHNGKVERYHVHHYIGRP